MKINLRNLTTLYNLLNKRNNFDIFSYVYRNPDCTQMDIVISKRIEQSNVAQRIAKFIRLGVLSAQKDGKYVRYKVNYTIFDTIDNDLNDGNYIKLIDKLWKLKT